MTDDPRHLYDTAVDELANTVDFDVTKMMGMPALKRNGKMFAGYRDGMLVVKLGRDRVDALVEKGARAFDPSGRGRPMKDWVSVPPARNWLDLLEEASNATRSL
jgi:TfoX/Sxy family transcriptional regulator of competence genes